MHEEIVKSIRDAGIIGAGGAGFPTHIKAGSRVEIVIANGSECEPLSQADQQLMSVYAKEIVRGLTLLKKATGARKGVIALKRKYTCCIESLSKAIEEDDTVEIFLLDDYYPAGDEFILVYEITGRVISEGNIPVSENVLVQNVGTLFHIAEAERGIPVTHRFVTVLGEVAYPATFSIPVGTAFEDVVAMAGGVKIDDFAIIYGGPMMGRVTYDLSTPLSKTTGMILILPMNHPLISLKTRNFNLNRRLIRSVCTQCRYCTDLCPRYLLGHSIQPHKIMRSLDYGIVISPEIITSAVLCSGCGLCEIYACMQDLSPRQVILELKSELTRRGYRSELSKNKTEPMHDMNYRRVPTERLLYRLGLKDYLVNAPLSATDPVVKKVKINLKQHIGSPAFPVVNKGDFVQKGELIADIPRGTLGARYHASVSGKVQDVKNETITIIAA